MQEPYTKSIDKVWNQHKSPAFALLQSFMDVHTCTNQQLCAENAQQVAYVIMMASHSISLALALLAQPSASLTLLLAEPQQPLPMRRCPAFVPLLKGFLADFEGCHLLL